VKPSLRVITTLRRDYPHVPICLIGMNEDFQSWPNVPTNWRERFTHYYRIQLDTDDATRQEQVALVFSLFLADVIKASAFKRSQTLEVPFGARKSDSTTGRITGRMVATLAAAVTLLVPILLPNVFGFEDRPCAALQTSYPDRIACRGVEAGFLWHVTNRTTATPQDGFTLPAQVLRCDASAADQLVIGETWLKPSGSFDDVVVPAGARTNTWDG